MDKGIARKDVKAAVAARTGWTPSNALLKRVGRDGRAERPRPSPGGRRWWRPVDVVEALERLHRARAGRQKRRLDDERYWQAWFNGGLRGQELRETLLSLTRVEPGSPVRRFLDRPEHDCEAIRSFLEIQADKARGSHHPLISYVRRNLGPLLREEPSAVADIMVAVVAPYFGETHAPTWDGKAPNFAEIVRTGFGLDGQAPEATCVSFFSPEALKDGFDAVYRVGSWPHLRDRLDEISDERLEAADRLLRAWTRFVPAVVQGHAVAGAGAPLGSVLMQVLARVLTRYFERYETKPSRPHSRMLATMTIVMAFLCLPMQLEHVHELTRQLERLTAGAHAFMTVVRDLPMYRSYLIRGGMERVAALDLETRQSFQDDLAAYYERKPHLKAALLALAEIPATES